MRSQGSLPRISDVATAGWIDGTILDQMRRTVPTSLSQSWGEASWTARDLWINSPAFTATRASAALSSVIPLVEVGDLHRTYRRVRRARQRRAQEESSTPTFAMLALGSKVASWTATVVVLALALIVILLGFELGVFNALMR
jgi:hypothetical protein